MNVHRHHGPRHVAELAVLVALAAGAASAWAGPPTATAPATLAAGASYQACLRADLLRQPREAHARAVAEAAVACGGKEAALSAAVLKENPDRPLFARSYAQTLKEAVLAQLSPAAGKTELPLLLALRTRP